MRVLIDTCVIMDALQNREPFAEGVKKIFLAVANKRFSGYITAKSSIDIYYLIHRLTHKDKETRKILSKLFTLFEVLDSAGIDCRKALSSGLSDYEDAVMVETAVRSDIDCIVTRNPKDYLKFAVFVCSPDEFLNSLSNSCIKRRLWEQKLFLILLMHRATLPIKIKRK